MTATHQTQQATPIGKILVLILAMATVLLTVNYAIRSIGHADQHGNRGLGSIMINNHCGPDIEMCIDNRPGRVVQGTELDTGEVAVQVLDDGEIVTAYVTRNSKGLTAWIKRMLTRGFEILH